MTNVLILSGPNHRFEESAEVIHRFLSMQSDVKAMLTDDKDILQSPKMNTFDVCVFGTGFTRSVRQDDGTMKRLPELSKAQEDGLFSFVSSGKGLVGIHGSGWWIGGRAVELLGGHANWHPAGSTFTVNIEDFDHEITQDMDDFEVDDEIYISAYDPSIRILASAEWHGRAHPVVWVKPYGKGRVFYTTLGHGPSTFGEPTMQEMVARGVRWAGSAA